MGRAAGGAPRAQGATAVGAAWGRVRWATGQSAQYSRGMTRVRTALGPGVVLSVVRRPDWKGVPWKQPNLRWWADSGARMWWCAGRVDWGASGSRRVSSKLWVRMLHSAGAEGYICNAWECGVRG